jgi:hypothetical protein
MTTCAHRSDTDTATARPPLRRMVRSRTPRTMGISAPCRTRDGRSGCWCVGPDASADPVSPETLPSVRTIEHRRCRSGNVKIIGWIGTRLAGGRRFSCPDEFQKPHLKDCAWPVNFSVQVLAGGPIETANRASGNRPTGEREITCSPFGFGRLDGETADRAVAFEGDDPYLVAVRRQSMGAGIDNRGRRKSEAVP